jgi:hypothetical protein
MSEVSRSEASIEKAVVDYAKKRGCLVRKMNGMGARSWPDRMFIGPPDLPPRMPLLNELKRGGEVPTPAQATMLLDLSRRGVVAVTTDSVEAGKDVLDAWLDDSRGGMLRVQFYRVATHNTCMDVLEKARK